MMTPRIAQVALRFGADDLDGTIVEERIYHDAGATTTGQIVTALRMMGFDQVYDTCFGADFTVVEEGNEFLKRFTAGENLPQFTSCCPAWVKFAEQYYPEMIPNLSTCKSPKQMFGSLCKDKLTRDLNIPREKLVVVSIMPCTAKKFEANREEFRVDDNKDVDFVLTTRELALMIKENGIKFNQLESSSFDMPFGFKTGASVIFGTSGGVSEAVLRYAASKLCGDADANLEFTEVRTHDGLNIVEVKVGEATLRLAVVSGLANARNLIDRIRRGEEQFDLVEVMACCGGCVNGGGQPVSEKKGTLRARSKGLYDNDKSYQMRNSKDNPYLKKSYEDDLTEDKAHRLLHTQYKNRRRISKEEIVMSDGKNEKPLQLNICFGRSCFLRGAQDLYSELMKYLRAKGLEKSTEMKVSFCGEHCKKGPVLTVNGKTLEHCTPQKAIGEIERVFADCRGSSSVN
jgi:NADH-quinone oxidoreductase subunit G